MTTSVNFQSGIGINRLSNNLAEVNEEFKVFFPILTFEEALANVSTSTAFHFMEKQDNVENILTLNFVHNNITKITANQITTKHPKICFTRLFQRDFSNSLNLYKVTELSM